MNGHLRRLMRRLTWARFERSRVIRYSYRRHQFFVNGRTAQRLVLLLAMANNNNNNEKGKKQ